jgi:hypothetical protein
MSSFKAYFSSAQSFPSADYITIGTDFNDINHLRKNAREIGLKLRESWLNRYLVEIYEKTQYFNIA